MRIVARLLFAPLLVVAVAVLVKGYADTGDGFAAGVIAALAVLLQFVALGVAETERLLPLRAATPCAFAGLLLALGIGFAPVLWGESLFTHYPLAGRDVIELGTLELITAVLFDVGVFLLVLGVVVGVMRFIADPGEETEL